MNTFESMKISTKLMLLVGVFLVGFLSFGALSLSTLNTVKVNGPVYDKIVQGKDVIADILPPPEYVIESYLLVLQLTTETDAKATAKLVERSKALRTEYEDRHKFWLNGLSEGPVKQTLTIKSYAPAMAFFETRDGEFIPAVLAGDRAKALSVANGTLKAHYETHRAAIDEVVAMSTAENTSYETHAKDLISQATKQLVTVAFVAIAIALILSGFTARMANAYSARVATAAAVATKIADGDLTTVVEARADDETGKMLSAIGNMNRSLNSLVARVKVSSIELMSTATEIAATSRQQEETMSGFGASTTEIAAAVKEISATSFELLSTMDEVNQVAGTTANLAEDGKKGLTTIELTMRHLSDSTSTISSKLSVIHERAADINLVVTTITKVADQTNLLSVNAAIEAEKAGEYGRGFLVLAREIRRLADQTAVATLDIEKMVRQMQGAVTAGVMEMDKFTEEVRRGVTSVSQTSGELNQIIEQVQTLSSRFDSVNEGMRSQSEGARQINSAMIQLTDGARQTSTSLREFNSATGHLREAVDGLKQEISHFTVAG